MPHVSGVTVMFDPNLRPILAFIADKIHAEAETSVVEYRVHVVMFSFLDEKRP